MPQISLYIDDQTLRKIESAAKSRHLSISKWVAEQLRSKVDAVYPENYEQLFGSINDESFVRPAEQPYARDVQREQM